jgi:hypothetical protein
MKPKKSETRMEPGSVHLEPPEPPEPLEPLEPLELVFLPGKNL